MKRHKSAIFVQKSIKNILKSEIISIIQVNIEWLQSNTCNLKYDIAKEITVIFDNGSNYDHHFIIKELAEESEGQFTCLVKTAEKYINFSSPIQKKLKELVKTEKKLQKPYITN